MLLLLHSCLLILCQCNSGFSSDLSVIIVGAGPAGIAAATKLLENSITDVKILEAEDRIGGRINSVKFGEAYVDVGAEYCHGEEGNVVYELAKDFDILESNSTEYNVYYSNGTKLDSNFVEEIESLLLELEYTGDEGEDYNLTGKSLGDLFIDKFNSTLLKKYKNDPEKLKILNEGLRFAEGFIVTIEGSFSWFDSSADTDYRQCKGHQDIIWKGCGYKTILEILMKSYPDPNKKLAIDDKIHLNKKVTKINWNMSEIVTVQTLGNTSYSADYVIFTPSVGVLKERHETIFSPQLPPSKQEAIEAIGYAGVLKIFMYFPIRWWGDDEKNFSFFWSEEDINSIDFRDGPTKNGLSWIVQFRDVGEAPSNPNVLIGWFGGDLVPEIEKLPLETLKAGCIYVIKKFLGKSYNVTEVGQIMRSTWCSNENFRGTYSYTKTGLYKKELSFPTELAQPLNGSVGKPVLFFAGESTNSVHFSTVHGAIETGYREAERIIALQKKA